MNPNAPHSTSPFAMMCSVWTHRTLIKQLTKREISGRYRGSVLGLAWSFFNPLLMLSIYTFVFSFIFNARWGVNQQEGQVEFALILFIGLIIHSLLAEVISSAPTQILHNTNYVKKVVFPLEILSIVSVATAIFHAVVGFLVLLLAITIFSGTPTHLAILAPLTVLPTIPLLLGLSWIFASLGVYVRDIAQLIGLAITALLFLAPVFYPMSVVPVKLQKIIVFNPITVPVTNTRNVLLFGVYPDWVSLAFYSLASVLICCLGFWWFQSSRKGFSDVI